MSFNLKIEPPIDTVFVIQAAAQLGILEGLESVEELASEILLDAVSGLPYKLEPKYSKPDDDDSNMEENSSTLSETSNAQRLEHSPTHRRHRKSSSSEQSSQRPPKRLRRDSPSMQIFVKGL